MKLIKLLCTSFACVFLLNTSFVASAQKKNVVIIETMNIPIVTEISQAYQQHLIKAFEPNEINVRVINAYGSYDKATNIIAEAINGPTTPDLLVSVATLATRALLDSRQLHSIPMQFMVVADPVNEGIVDKIGNKSEYQITGQPHVIPTKAKLDLIRQTIKGQYSASRPLKIALLSSDYPSSTSIKSELLSHVSAYPEIQFIEVNFSYYPGETGRIKMREQAYKAMVDVREAIDVYLMPSGPLSYDPEFVTRLDTELSIPKLFSTELSGVKDGAIVGIFSKYSDIGLAAANISFRILSGVNPREMAITAPTNFSIAVNLNTAIKHGFIVSSDVLALASTVFSGKQP